MKTAFNFQINLYRPRREWDKIEPFSYPFDDRQQAVKFAKSLARTFKAEVRLTQGDPFRVSGSYFHYIQN